MPSPNAPRPIQPREPHSIQPHAPRRRPAAGRVLAARARRAAIAVAVLLLWPAASQAENDIDDDYRASVTKLLELQRTPEAVSQQLTYSVAQQMLGSYAANGIAITEPLRRVVLEASKSTIGDRFDDAEVLGDLYVPIYAEIYSQKELDELIAFWESPVGQKTIERMPEMTQRSFGVLEQAGAPYVSEFQETVEKRIEAEGIALVPQAALGATPSAEPAPESSTGP